MRILSESYDRLNLSRLYCYYVFNRRFHLEERLLNLNSKLKNGTGGEAHSSKYLLSTPRSFMLTLSSLTGSRRSGDRFFSSSPCSNQSMNIKNHYEILDVNRSATTLEIREAFLNLSKEYHPDLNTSDPKGNHEKFVAINEAYMILSKPSSRRDYDLTLQVKKHLRQQTNYAAHRQYGYHDMPHYHYRTRNHVDWDGMSSSSQADHTFRSGKRLHNLLVNFYSLSAFFTIGFISFIMACKDYIAPVLPRKRVLGTVDDLSKHDFIMTSVHEGQTVLYYAVPDDNNPDIFKIRAFLKKEVEGDTNEYILEELNSV